MCFQTFHVLERSRRTISYKGLGCYQLLKKVKSNFMRNESQRGCRRFLADFVSRILHTIAACFLFGHRIRCFCLQFIIVGNVYSAIHLFGQLLGRLLKLAWVRGQKCRLGKLSSVLLFVSSNRCRRVPIDHVNTSVLSLRCFRNQLSNLYKVSIGLKFSVN